MPPIPAVFSILVCFSAYCTAAPAWADSDKRSGRSGDVQGRPTAGKLPKRGPVRYTGSNNDFSLLGPDLHQQDLGDAIVAGMRRPAYVEVFRVEFLERFFPQTSTPLTILPLATPGRFSRSRSERPCGNGGSFIEVFLLEVLFYLSALPDDGLPGLAGDRVLRATGHEVVR